MKIIEQIVIWSMKSDMVYEEEHHVTLKNTNNIILNILSFKQNFEMIEVYLYKSYPPHTLSIGLKRYILAVIERAKFKIERYRHNKDNNSALNFRYNICLLRIKYFIEYLNGRI